MSRVKGDVRDGTAIREQLIKIQADIQHILNKLSNFLRQVLKVELNINHFICYPSGNLANACSTNSFALASKRSQSTSPSSSIKLVSTSAASLSGLYSRKHT